MELSRAVQCTRCTNCPRRKPCNDRPLDQSSARLGFQNFAAAAREKRDERMAPQARDLRGAFEQLVLGVREANSEGQGLVQPVLGVPSAPI